MSGNGIPLPRIRSGDLPLEMAQAAMDAAVAYAISRALQVSIAVVDSGGHLLTFARVSGTPWHSIDLAIDKARTSASFALPSSTLADMVDSASERIRMNLMLRPDIIAMGGAFPLLLGDRLVGAIGVSGASEEEDMDCANAGREAIAQCVQPLESNVQEKACD
ncbi:heme-binding protein [Halopseudomonas phragmitis]|uniref:Heme-binding protein n=1 Tax=Halopseudomonas phragmitis TaxID=1931241 RepID=A0A1V0B8J3_9GAMM|nr:heme-binding protein [Halopseudomonas phragmitis]AQZ96227.1 hypothetical protein BVH74_16355 [Halopseudomonas phragmitis]PAU89305.1 heme-binding protein [Pseudomonas sp. WN033]